MYCGMSRYNRYVRVCVYSAVFTTAAVPISRNRKGCPWATEGPAGVRAEPVAAFAAVAAAAFVVGVAAVDTRPVGTVVVASAAVPAAAVGIVAASEELVVAVPVPTEAPASLNEQQVSLRRQGRGQKRLDSESN